MPDLAQVSIGESFVVADGVEPFHMDSRVERRLKDCGYSFIENDPVG